MPDIHPTALIGDQVRLGKDVRIGPYCVLEGECRIGDGTSLHAHVHIMGRTTLGKNCTVFSGAVLGGAPQDLSWDGVLGEILIGDGTVLREFVTVHSPIRAGEGLQTRIGNQVFMMANAHAAHNTQIGDNAILANGALAAGFVEIGKNAFISGNVGIHQFCRIGSYAIVGACSKVSQDIPPYMMVTGNPGRVNGLNVVGLRRGGFNQEQRNEIKQAFKILYSGLAFKEAADQIEAMFPQNQSLREMLDMVRTTKRGITAFCDNE